MKYFTLAILLLASLPAGAQPVFEWVRHGGGSSVDLGYALDIDPAGCIYLAGDYNGTATFGSDTVHAINSASVGSTFLAKYSPAGDLLWVRPVGGYDFVFMTLDARGHLYIAGAVKDTVVVGDTVLFSRTASIAIARFDTSGRFEWARKFDASDGAIVADIAVAGDGSALLTGWFEDRVYFGSHTLVSRGQDDVFLAKISSSGAVSWALREGGPYSDNAHGVTVDREDNIYTCGDYGSRGHYAVFGTDTLRPVGGRDAFLAKYSPSGTYLWSRSAGGDWNSSSGWGDVARDIVCDTRGTVYLTGHTGLTATFGDTIITAPGERMVGFIAAFGTDGAFRWVRQFGGTDGADGFRVAVDSAGSVYACGSIYGMTPFGELVLGDADTERGLFVTKIDPDGQFRWALPIGGGHEFNNYAFAVCVSPRDEIYVTGSIGGDSVRIGPFTISPQWSDMFLVKIRDDQASAVENPPGMTPAAVHLDLFPHPVRSQVSILTTAPIDQLHIVDALGRVILVMRNVMRNRVSFDIGSAPPGMYMLHVRYTDGRRASKRFVKIVR